MATDIAPAPRKELTLRDHLRNPKMIEEIAKALPKHCDPDRMARIALTALTRTPKLQHCTQESFFECLFSLSQWGLEPDGRRAHLIPYGNKCTLIIDYKGYVELAFRSGKVKKLHADVVRDGDIFEYSLGEIQKHTPWYLRKDADKPKEAGKVFAAYCMAELEGGTVKTEVMSHAEIEAIRNRSKSGQSGPWVTDWAEMAKKTAFRRLSKWLPLSAEVLDAMDRDDDRPPEIQAVATMPRPSSLNALTEQLTDANTIDADPQPADEPQDSPAPADDDWQNEIIAAFDACESVDAVNLRTGDYANSRSDKYEFAMRCANKRIDALAPPKGKKPAKQSQASMLDDAGREEYQ